MFEKWYEAFRVPVEDDINKFIDEKISECSGYNSFLIEVYEGLREYVFRTGRMGSSLALAAFAGYTNKNPGCAEIRVGTAIEMYGFGILVHDDILDMDETRAGKKSYHKIYEDNAEKYGFLVSGKCRFGQSLGIIGGDILYGMAVDAISGTSLPSPVIKRLIQNLNKGYIRLNESQVIDLVFENTMPSVADWYQMASRRAAAHVFTCISSGGILARWGGKEKQIMQEVALHMGYIYDIRDDILGVFSEGTNLQQMNDIAKKKKPLYFCYALKNAVQRDRELLLSFYQNRESIPCEEVLMLLKKYGLSPAIKDLEEYASKAKTLLEKSGLNGDAKQFYKDSIDNSTQKVYDLIYQKMPGQVQTG